jgi:hypothetical protein
LRHCGADRETLVLSAEAIGEDEITATADSDANAKAGNFVIVLDALGVASDHPDSADCPGREFHRWDAPGIRWDEKQRGAEE